jgi:hypothetical protein
MRNAWLHFDVEYGSVADVNDVVRTTNPVRGLQLPFPSSRVSTPKSSNFVQPSNTIPVPQHPGYRNWTEYGKAFLTEALLLERSRFFKVIEALCSTNITACIPF